MVYCVCTQRIATSFVTRDKSNTKFKRRYSYPVYRFSSNNVSNQTDVLTVFNSSQGCPTMPCRMVARDETSKRITFLTNNFALKPELISGLYRQRWQGELFYKWIKQHLRIKMFLGTSENAMRIQIRIAVNTYVLIAIPKQRLHLPQRLYEILQIMRMTMFETTPTNQLLTAAISDSDNDFKKLQRALL